MNEKEERELDELLREAMRNSGALREAKEWASRAKAPEAAAALALLEKLPEGLNPGAEKSLEATDRERLGGDLIRAIWRDASVAFHSFAPREREASTANARFAGSESGSAVVSRPGFWRLCVEQAFESAGADEALAGFVACSGLGRENGAFFGLGWQGIGLAAAKFESPAQAATLALGARPDFLFKIDWHEASARLSDGLLRRAAPAQTLAARARFFEAVLRLGLDGGFLDRLSEEMSSNPGDWSLERTLAAWRNAASDWSLVSETSRLPFLMREACSRLDGVLAEIRHPKDPAAANKWLDERDFHALRRAAENGASAIPYMKAVVLDRERRLGRSLAISDLFLRLQNENEETLCALSNAADAQTVRFLLDSARATPENVVDDEGATPFFHVKSNARADGERCLAALAEAGFDPNRKNNAGETPFHCLAKRFLLWFKGRDYFQALFDCGGDPSQPDARGRDAAQWALERCQESRNATRRNGAPSPLSIENHAEIERWALLRVSASQPRDGRAAAPSPAEQKSRKPAPRI